MQLNTVPATTGAAWLRDGWRLLRTQPLGLPAMVVVYLFMLLVPAQLPYVGIAIAGVLSPFATLGMLACCREVWQRRAPTPAQFAQPFRDAQRRLPLLRLGIINAVLWMVIASVALVIGPDTATSGQPTSMQDIPLDALIAQLLLYSPVLVVMLFAPPLAGWHALPPGKAMFGSAIACWRNKGALSVYGALTMAVLVGVSLIAVALIGVLGVSQTVAQLVLAPLGLALLALIQATMYPMYRSIFEVEFAADA